MAGAREWRRGGRTRKRCFVQRSSARIWSASRDLPPSRAHRTPPHAGTVRRQCIVWGGRAGPPPHSPESAHSPASACGGLRCDRPHTHPPPTHLDGQLDRVVNESLAWHTSGSTGGREEERQPPLRFLFSRVLSCERERRGEQEWLANLGAPPCLFIRGSRALSECLPKPLHSLHPRPETHTHVHLARPPSKPHSPRDCVFFVRILYLTTSMDFLRVAYEISTQVRVCGVWIARAWAACRPDGHPLTVPSTPPHRSGACATCPPWTACAAT